MLTKMSHKVRCLGRYCLNIDLIDLFLECEDNNITSYADTTPHSCAKDISSGISELQRIAEKKLYWCKKNHTKSNCGKYHVILS